MWNELLKVIGLSIFIDRCKLCGNDLVLAHEKSICSDCKEKITAFSTTLCCHCGRPLWNDAVRCVECIINPPLFLRHISYGRYDDVLKELILKYKYGKIDNLKHLLAGYYLEILNKQIPEKESREHFDFIIPVPPDMGRRRDFNPILEMAKILSKHSEIPLLPGRLVKIKKTLPQAGLSRSRRLSNLDGAFKLIDVPPPLTGKRVLLVDDVYTTGTTIRKCTVRLVKEGASVVALTLARSV
jgi:ComF family protein